MTQKNTKIQFEKQFNKDVLNLAHALNYEHITPDIVQPANTYFDLLGDDLRSRLFTVQDPMNNGAVQDYVLRPEFTICIAREYLAQKVQEGQKTARMVYSGPVFRANRKTGKCKEFTQTGIEIFAEPDQFKADIEVVEFSIKAVKKAAIDHAKLKMGDYELFFTLVENLKISDIWKKKLKRLFLSNDNLSDLMVQLNKPQKMPSSQERGAFLATIRGLEPQSAQMLVENVLSFSGIDLIGGRSAGEIAMRFLEQAAISASPTLEPNVVEILNQYFNINGSADDVIAALKQFNNQHKLGLDENIKMLDHRFDAIDALNIDDFPRQNIEFSCLLGRGFEYYTGMVFEIVDQHNRISAPLIGGGRYDSLVKQLGAKEDIFAVGASLWDGRFAKLIELEYADE